MTSLLSITSHGMLLVRIKSETRDAQPIAFPELSSDTAGEGDGLGVCLPFLACMLVRADGTWLSHVHGHICLIGLPEGRPVLPDVIASNECSV